MATQIDVKKLTEADWEKYKHMQHIRQNGNWRHTMSIFFGMVLVSITAIAILGLLSSISNASTYYPTLNYTTKLLNTTITQLNVSNLVLTHNSSIVPLINSFSSHPQALATMVVYEYVLLNYAGKFLLVLVPIFLFIFVLWGLKYGLRSDNPSVPSSFKTLKRWLNHISKGDNRLRAHKYTEQDIAWYHAVDKAIMQFTYIG